MTIQQHASFDSSAAELNATSKLVKAWESKNAKNAAKAGGISLMALSLAACGGSDDTAAVVDGGTAADDATTDDGATTPVALSDLQADVGAIVLSNVTGVATVEEATLSLASNATALEVTATTTAPTTVAATEAMVGEAITNIIDALDANYGGAVVSTALDALDAGTYTAGAATPAAVAANYDVIVGALTAGDAASKTALTAALTNLEAVTGNAATIASINVTTATNTFTAGTTATAAEAADIAAIKGVSDFLVANIMAQVNTDASAVATPGEEANADFAFNKALATAVLSATSTTLTEAQTATLDAALALVANAPTTAADASNGLIIGDLVTPANTLGVAGTVAIDLDLVVDQIDLALGGGAATVAAMIATGLMADNAGTLNLSAAGQALFQAQFNSGIASEMEALYDDLIEMVQVVADAGVSSEALDVQARILELENDGSQVQMATGASVTLSDNDDFVGYITALDNNVTIGSATESFGATGNDSLIISGDYKFETIDKAQADAIATVDDLGDVSVLEIFAYQNATTGDTVLYVERTAGEGHVEGATMSTITLVDTAFADLAQLSGEGLTVLSSEAVIA